MGEIFTPEDRIRNILFVLDELQRMLQASDTAYTAIWTNQIQRTFIDLNEAISDMTGEK